MLSRLEKNDWGRYWKAFRNQIAGRKLRQRRQNRICSTRKWTATKIRSGWKSKPKRDERPEKFPPFCETVAKKEEAEGGKLFAARADQNRNNFLNDELSAEQRLLSKWGWFLSRKRGMNSKLSSGGWMIELLRIGSLLKYPSMERSSAKFLFKQIQKSTRHKSLIELLPIWIIKEMQTPNRNGKADAILIEALDCILFEMSR